MIPNNQKEALAWASRHRADDDDAIAPLTYQAGRRAAAAAACILALSALGGDAARRAVASYRPQAKRGGRFGDTFADPIAKAMSTAWNRFREPALASECFDGVAEIHWANGGILDHLDGLEHVRGLSLLNARVSRSASCEPLTRCQSLETLILSGEHGPEDLQPLGRIPRLRRLAVIALSQAALGFAARAPLLQTVTVTLTPGLRLSPLLTSRELTLLGIPDDAPSDQSSLRELARAVERGVEVTLYNPAHDWRQIHGGAVDDARHLIRLTAEKTAALAG